MFVFFIYLLLSEWLAYWSLHKGTTEIRDKKGFYLLVPLCFLKGLESLGRSGAAFCMGHWDVVWDIGILVDVKQCCLSVILCSCLRKMVISERHRHPKWVFVWLEYDPVSHRKFSKSGRTSHHVYGCQLAWMDEVSSVVCALCFLGWRETQVEPWKLVLAGAVSAQLSKKVNRVTCWNAASSFRLISKPHQCICPNGVSDV